MHADPKRPGLLVLHIPPLCKAMRIERGGICHRELGTCRFAHGFVVEMERRIDEQQVALRRKNDREASRAAGPRANGGRRRRRRPVRESH